MSRLLKFSDTSALRISVITYDGKTKYLSLRSLYRTKKDVEADGEWRPGYAGITLSLDDCTRVIKGMIKVFKDPDAKVVKLERKGKK